MDKRTLIFVFCLTAAFFAVNVFFGARHDEHVPAEVPAPTVAVVEEASPVQISSGEEKFYVLENEYQQLVFSNVGGALAEINLPFASDIVKETGADRQMEEDDPANAYFPSFNYYVAGETSEQTERKLGGYYPLLRRPLIDRDGEVIASVPPQFYSLNVVSKYPEVAQMIYQVKEFTPNKIVFEAQQDRRTIRKTYTLGDAPYVIDVAVDVDGDLSQGLFLTSGVPEVELMSGKPIPALKVRTERAGKFEVSKVSRPKQGQTVAVGSIHPNWLSNGNGFFGIIVDPLTDIGMGYQAEYVPGEEVQSRLVMIDREHNKYKAAQLPGYNTLLPLKKGSMQFRIYSGPYDNAILKQVDKTFTPNPDYHSARSFHGYLAFISKPFAKFLLVIMDFFYWLTGSWGFSIILLTVVLRLILFPLSSWSMKSMRRMQKIQPEVTKIQKKYKKDPRRSQMEIMQLYRKRKVNPVSGCLPLIIQMPFLVGMFALLKSNFALRGASFIPGWINDLTAPDVLFSWGTPIFFLGTEFHLLPILLGLVMFIQQRFSSTLPKDKSLWTDQQRQQRMMGNVMVGVFAVMFYNFPSGLNIYWLSSMSLGILQQWIINKRMDKQVTQQPASTTPS